jgi:hypothetical protein
MNDPKDQKPIRGGTGQRYGQLEVGKNALLQLIIDELRDKRLIFNGSHEDWLPVFSEFLNLFRSWDTNSLGEKTFTWESSGPQNFIKAVILFRVGMEKFAENKGKVVTMDDEFGFNTGTNRTGDIFGSQALNELL